jgi:hypothetical protein
MIKSCKKLLIFGKILQKSGVFNGNCGLLDNDVKPRQQLSHIPVGNSKKKLITECTINTISYKDIKDNDDILLIVVNCPICITDFSDLSVTVDDPSFSIIDCSVIKYYTYGKTTVLEVNRSK